jgi:hypothetical protein
MSDWSGRFFNNAIHPGGSMKRFRGDKDTWLFFAATFFTVVYTILLTHPFWPFFALAATEAFSAVVSFFGPDGETKLLIFLVAVTILVAEVVYMTTPGRMEKAREAEKKYFAKPADRQEKR